MSSLYRRTRLASKMAQQLLHPGVLDEGLRSGLFLSGLRRTGKTTFLINDLIPALEESGALVIYVDLWSDVQTNPLELVRRAIRGALADLQSPVSAIMQKVRRAAAKTEVSGYGLKFSFALDKVGERRGATLARALREVVDQAKTDLVLIIDEVQHALASEDGDRLLLALKAARDAINSRPDTPGHFLFVGTGSHRALVSELVTRRNQAFAGATSLSFPVLDGEYIEHVLERLREEEPGRLPSHSAVMSAFETLGHRPEELVRALRVLRSQSPPEGDPDTHLRVIAATLRASAANVELTRLDQLGGLATAIFDRIATTDGPARGIFSADAAAAYSNALGRDVGIEEIQPAVGVLLASNLIMRRAYGTYGITDPFVQDAWLENKRLTASL